MDPGRRASGYGEGTDAKGDPQQGTGRTDNPDHSRRKLNLPLAKR